MKNLGACGIDCNTCKFKLEGNCGGCNEIKGKPFWGECEWYSCSHGKGHENCGCCKTFPCDKLTEALKNEGANQAIDNLKEYVATHSK